MKNFLDLQYRFGFIVSSTNLPQFDCFDFSSGWNKFVFSENLFVYHHYQTKLVKYEFKSKTIVTLGDVFVAHGDLSIKSNLELFSEKESWDSIDNLSGRFSVVVFNNKYKLIESVFSDPISSRTLYYSVVEKSVVASHCSLLSAVVRAKPDEKVQEFISGDDFRSIRTKFLPADLTGYENIFGLPANHYYSFKDYRVSRFWPRKEIESRSLEDIFDLSKEYFNNYVDWLLSCGVEPVFGLTGGGRLQSPHRCLLL